MTDIVQYRAYLYIVRLCRRKARSGVSCLRNRLLSLNARLNNTSVPANKNRSTILQVKYSLTQRCGMEAIRLPIDSRSSDHSAYNIAITNRITKSFQIY